MKIKLLSLFLICIMQQMVMAAQEKTIKTEAKAWETRDRSLSAVPALSHYENTVFIYSNFPLENMEVIVTDTSGGVAYVGILSIEASQTISFTFNETGSGEYKIEITHGNKYLYGWFEIDTSGF